MSESDDLTFDKFQRWRLLLGKGVNDQLSSMRGAGGAGGGCLSGPMGEMDDALGAIYDREGEGNEGGKRGAGLGASAPRLARWLGDVRKYFERDVVVVIQQDAIERKGLKQLLFEPETLAQITPSVELVGTLLSLKNLIPDKTKETARQVVSAVVEEIKKRLSASVERAVRGALNRSTHQPVPSLPNLDWKKTIRANLKNYQADRKTIIPDQFFFHARQQRRREWNVIVCMDQSGSMAESVVYASVMGAIFASIPALETHVIAFDTEVVDLTEECSDPVELLFGVQLGGGTDINRAVTYCQGLIHDPRKTLLLLITDLYEGGNETQLVKRLEEMAASGVRAICLLALSDSGIPSYDERLATRLANVGVPCLGCTPGVLPQVLEGLLKGRNLRDVAAMYDTRNPKKLGGPALAEEPRPIVASADASLPPSVSSEAVSTPVPPAHASDAPSPGGPTLRGSRLTSIAIASALFMEFIDSTALSTALPTLSRAFHTDPLLLKLALTSYILALAVFAPASGWVADRFGPKRVFMSAMVVFLVGSMLCGLSRSLGQLVACRLVQGVGGAMMTPVARLIIVGTTPRSQLVSAMAWFTMPALVGPLLGPPLAGLILGVADWPWIFYVNAPVCLIGLAAIARLVPSTRPPHPGPFDVLGFVYAAVAISALVGATETFGVDVAPRSLQIAALGLALLAAVAYLRHARRTARPVLDLALFRIPTFRASLTGGTILRLGIGASPLLLPLLLQVALGWTPLKAGLVSVWQSVGALSAKPATPALLRRYGFRTILIATVLGASVLTALPGFFRAGMPVAALVALFVGAGFVRSNQFTATNAVAYADVPADRVSAASTLATVTQQVGLSLGISFGGTVLHLTKGAGDALTPERFVAPYLAVGAVTLLALPVYWRLPASAGASLRGEARGAKAPRG